MSSISTNDIQSYEIQIADNYILNSRRKLGSGSFGEIYYGYQQGTEREVAIKLEQVKTKYPQLFYESKIYMTLKGGKGIPNLHWCGAQGNFNIMIIDLLGPSLEDLFNICGRKFSLKTSLMITEQMLNRIEYMHSKSFIHRDIKPDNFLIGRKKLKNIIHVIDFGLAKRYRDIKTNMHINYRDGKSLTGTARFASINTHLGIEQSRRDDLESIGYCLIYFLKGSLPWQGLKARTNNEKYLKIMEVKIQTSIESLCKDLPKELEKIIFFTRDLTFDENPDYCVFKKMLYEIAEKNNISFDDVFDWNIKMTEKERRKLSIDSKE